MRSLINNFFYMNLFIGSMYFYVKICNKEKTSIKCITNDFIDEMKEKEKLNKCYNVIYYVSYLSCIPSIYGIYKGYYDLSLMSGVVTLTSVNFWRNPDLSWRREVDIHFVRLSVLYHILRAYKSQNRNIYYLISGSAITCYPISIYFFIDKEYWMFTLSHTLVHILGDLSNFILYYGDVPNLL